MNKRFLLIMAACIAIFAGLLIFNKRDATAPSTNVSTSNHTFGEGKSGVVLVEFGDFECPGCYRYYPVVKQLREKYKDQLTFQFKHYPLFEIPTHENALLAARSAEAAARQNKFWEMHDLLYENQPTWSESTNARKTFESFATQLQLDLAKFQADVASEEINAIVQADREEAKRLGATGTPTFVLDGKVIETPTSLEAFDQLIQDAIKQKTTS